MESQAASQAGEQFTVGTLDGTGAGDHDVPFQFGRRPRTEVPHPFSTRQYARLLALRSRIQAGPLEQDDTV